MVNLLGDLTMLQDDHPLFEFRGPWGIPVQIGISLFLLPLIIVDLGGSPRDLTFDVMFVIILIGSIFLHELGHAWGCLVQGIPVKRIMLYGGGGYCKPGRSSAAYERELIVVMGPIVNAFLWATAGLIAPIISDPEINWAIRTIAWVNGFLFLLNMLPVHPLDGGQLFQLFLHRFLPPTTAATISAGVGLVIAIFWLPMMVILFVNVGVVLFFLPSVRLHWYLLTNPKA